MKRNDHKGLAPADGPGAHLSDVSLHPLPPVDSAGVRAPLSPMDAPDGRERERERDPGQMYRVFRVDLGIEWARFPIACQDQGIVGRRRDAVCFVVGRQVGRPWAGPGGD